MNLSRSFPSSLTYLKQKKAGQKNLFQKANDRLLFLFLFSTFTAILINNSIIHKLKKEKHEHLTLFFAFGALLFLSCQTVSARGVKIPFGDREVLNKVADLPDTEEYKTDNGNYIDRGPFIRSSTSLTSFLSISSRSPAS